MSTCMCVVLLSWTPMTVAGLLSEQASHGSPSRKHFPGAPARSARELTFTAVRSALGFEPQGCLARSLASLLLPKSHHPLGSA